MIHAKEPIVSVIIPVYNISAFLPQCLESLIGQTLLQIEILCVDDASEDNSTEVVRMFQERDPRIRLLRQEHQGVSAARNLGIFHARGKYIAFVDGDDWVEADMLRRMLEKAEETACDVVVCSAKVHFEQQDVRGVRRRRSLQAALMAGDDLWIADGTSGDIWQVADRPGSWPFVWNKLIRSELIKEKAIRFSPTLPLGEDGVFLQLLFQYVKKAAFLPEQLYHYRYQRRDSATVKHFQDRLTRFTQHIEVVKVTLQEFSERELLRENGRELLLWILKFLYSDFVSLPAANRKSASVKIRDLLVQYDLIAFMPETGRIEKKRLDTMMETEKECTEGKRIFDIVWTKVENRLMRVFYRK